MKGNIATYLVRGCQFAHTLGKRDSFLPSTYQDSIWGEGVMNGFGLEYPAEEPVSSGDEVTPG